MNNNKLTAYDNFIINKRKRDIPMITSDEENRDFNCCNNSYADYIESQLRRTSPSSEKVLTKEEFEEKYINKNNNIDVLSNEEPVENYETNEETSSASESSIHFKKFGKLFLVAYVIIMLALALIVLVKTTVGDNYNSARADSLSVEENSNVLETMEDEESEENDNWFDKLCDSLE